MKQFLDILWFEFYSYLKNKVFILITVIAIVCIGIGLSWPRISNAIQGDTTSTNSGYTQKILVVNASNEDETSLKSAFNSNSQGIEYVFENKSIDEAKQLVNDGDYQSAVFIDSSTSFTYLVKNLGMYDVTSELVRGILQTNYRFKALSELGIDSDKIQNVLQTEITSNNIEIGKDQSANFFYTYILIFMLYMAIIIYGQLVATNVASEKSSRAMEVLITSAKPTNLLFGKVIGSGFAGLLQMAIMLTSAYVFYYLNLTYWAGNAIISTIFNIPFSILLYTLLFFVLGFFIYAFLYGAIGSMASKVEDINTTSMPLTLLFIVAFMVVVSGISSGSMDSPTMVIASYVPFTSPMAMFARISMSVVPAYEVLLSILILILSTALIGYLSARIYRVGVLHYGNPPKFGSILKAMFSKEK